jgi:hypothetical protein
MIAILFSFLLLMQESPVAQSTCPDLSGRYVVQGEDGRVLIHIKQTRCQRITIERMIYSYPDISRTTHQLVLDGKFHADTGWFGERAQRLTSAQFRSVRLEIVSQPAKTKDGAGFAWKQSLEMLPNRDLCTRFFDSYTKAWSVSRAGRQKSTDRAGEDDAARRSEEGC